MMAPLLLLLPGALSLVALSARGSSDEARRGTVRAVSVIGGVTAAVLFLLRGSEITWRTVELDGPRIPIAAAGILCAWLLVGTLPATRDRWDIAAWVGVASCGLGLAAANQWTVPLLLFWVAGSAAVIAALWVSDDATGALIVAVSDAAAVAALVGHALEEESWALPASLEGWTLWMLVAAVILRVGALPRAWAWGALDGAAAPFLCLLIAGGFVLLAGPGGGAHVAVALGLLVASAAAGIWVLVSTHHPRSLLGAWAVALMLGVATVAPDAAAQAGVTAVLAVTTLALWQPSLGRAQVERSLLFAFVPGTVGFGAVVLAAEASFGRATGIEDLAEAAPWAAVAGLLPVGAVIGVALSVRLGRRREVETYRPEPVLATWLLLAVVIVLGLSPGGLDVGGSSGRSGRELILYAVAVLLGIAAARFFARRGGRATEEKMGLVPERSIAPPLPSEASMLQGRAKQVSFVVAAVGVATLAATAWITFEGLRNGFLA